MSSYRQIFKSTAVIGAAQFANIGIGAIRNKALALLLAPAGFGLAGTYLTLTGFVGGITGLGLGMSGVREIAEAATDGNEYKLSRTVRALRCASLLSGVLGALVLLGMAVPLSLTTFGDHSHAGAIALMSLTLLFGSVSAGQLALLQGIRRLVDLGKSQIAGAFFGTLASIALVYFLRERGVALYLVVNSAMACCFSYWYARKIKVAPVNMGMAELWRESRGLVRLGFAFLSQNLVLGLGAYLNRVIIIDQLGLTAVGIYTATWTLSTYYVNMVLKAMGADFYPRLTASVNDHASMNRLVNEQVEMGLLIAAPGVLAVLTLAPVALQVLYSGEFVGGAEIIRWQMLGVLMQVVGWPVGYIQLAKGKGTVFVMTEIVSCFVGLASLLASLRLWRFAGIGIAAALACAVMMLYCVLVGRRLTGFGFSRKSLQVFSGVLLATLATFCSAQFMPAWWGIGVGLVCTVLGSAICVWELQRLLGINLWQRLLPKLGLGKSSTSA